MAGHPIETCQDLCEKATEVKRVNGKSRALNLGNQKKKWNDCGTSSESMDQKKLATSPNKSRPLASMKPCAKCG